MLVDVLRGSKRQEIVFAGYDKIKTHGAGAEIPAFDWQRYIMQMLNLGIIEMAYDENFALKITPAGNDILFGKKKIELTVLNSIKAVEKIVKTTRQPKIVSDYEDLFNSLRKVRRIFAEKENVPAYVIFSDASLDEMVRQKPTTAEEFLDISGVGEHKLFKYGEAFLNAINDFSSTSEIKKSKGSTYLDTLKMLKQNSSIEEIAATRNLAEATVYSHLAQLYLSGKVESLAKYVNEDEVNMIKEACIVVKETKIMKPIFEHLKEAVPYHKIRLALAVLEKRE
jgi:ATP-dependent DNA helicase RecQ